MPVPGSGISAQLGAKAEAAYGTYIAPDHWLEIEHESLELVPKRVQGKGLAAGLLVPRGTQRQQVGRHVSGQIKTSMFYKGMGLWLSQIMGSAAAPVQQGATAAYLQTHTLADSLGRSMTIQVGRPMQSNPVVVQPYTYLGCKVTDAIIECGVDELVSLTMSIDGRDCSEAQGLVAPTYAVGNQIFDFGEFTFKIGAYGAEAQVAGVRKVTASIKRPLRVDNFYADGTGLKAEPVMNGYADIGLDILTDFIDKTKFVDVFTADTPQSVICQWTGPIIAGAYAYLFTMSFPSVRFDTEGPKVPGEDILQPTMKAQVLYDDVHPAMVVTYMSTDIVL